ncbi:MAG TPA: DoxX family protein [Thermoleophilia bacterium]
MDSGRLLLRLVIGGLFIGHGTQKLFGWFGGSGLEATAQGFESLGLAPGRRNALAAGIAETAGGASLALGLATPLAAAGLISVMVTAVRTLHWKNGPWSTNGGYEYNAVLIAALLGLAEAGPGQWSLDHALGRERSGLIWLIAALAAGTAGSLSATALAHRPGGEPEVATGEAE